MIVVGMGYGYSWHHVRLRYISDMTTGTTNHNMNYCRAVVEQGTIGLIKLKEPAWNHCTLSHETLLDLSDHSFLLLAVY